MWSGADVNSPGYEAITPLHDAVINDHIKVCAILLLLHHFLVVLLYILKQMWQYFNCGGETWLSLLKGQGHPTSQINQKL